MRRDYFTLAIGNNERVEGDDPPRAPVLIVDFEGPASMLQERITGISAELLDESQIDVSFRYQTAVDADEPTGVISVTDRVTGDYVLEVNATADSVTEFLDRVREYNNRGEDNDNRYCLEIRIDGEVVVTYEKQAFLIYSKEGKFLRKHSLIPSGVEL